jgi:hypothetical protein
MEETVMPLRGWSGAVRYGVPGLLLGLVLMGGFGNVRGPSALAQYPPGGERSRVAATAGNDATGTIAFSTSSNGGTAQLLYLIDTKAHAFAIYRIDPSNPKGAVQLAGCRQYQWDLKLSEYSNAEPDVASVESMIKTLGQPAR